MFCYKLVVRFALHRIRNTDLNVHQVTFWSPSPLLPRGAIFSSGIFAVAYDNNFRHLNWKKALERIQVTTKTPS